MGKLVLVVDDEAATLKLIRKALETHRRLREQRG